MDDYKEILKKRLSELPESLKTFIEGDGWKTNVEKIGKQNNFNDEKLAYLENEVFLVLSCIQMPESFVENLKRELAIDENSARNISNYINGTVFGPVMREMRAVWGNENSNIPRERKDNTAISFEKTMINRAKAMRPAGSSAPIPSNLPTGQNQNYSNQRPELASTPRYYPPGGDPYREKAE